MGNMGKAVKMLAGEEISQDFKRELACCERTKENIQGVPKKERTDLSAALNGDDLNSAKTGSQGPRRKLYRQAAKVRI